LAAEAERDEVKKALWSDRGVMLDMQARLDKALAALREIAEVIPLVGHLDGHECNAIARAAIAEIEGEA
jgi:hypothetical protein